MSHDGSWTARADRTAIERARHENVKDLAPYVEGTEVMKIIVPIKWVGSADYAEALPDGSVSFAKARAAVSEYDSVAVEVAKQLAASTPGAEVIGISAGPSTIDTPLSRKAMLSRGLDRLILVADDELTGVDSLQTATVLAAVVRSVGFDIIIAGDASADRGDRQVGPMLGALLGVPTVCAVRDLRSTDAGLVFDRVVGDVVETITTSVPVVLSVASDAATAPVPGMKDIIAAAKKPTEAMTRAELDVTIPAGPTITARTRPATATRQATMIDTSDPTAAATELVAALRQRGAI